MALHGQFIWSLVDFNDILIIGMFTQLTFVWV